LSTKGYYNHKSISMAKLITSRKYYNVEQNIICYTKCITYDLLQEMYNIIFGENNTTITTSSNILECKNFAQLLYQHPGDRHAYSLKMYNTPIRYNCFLLLST
jgi:hypothetical protein